MRLAVLNLTGGGISGGHRKYLLNMLPRLAAAPEMEAVLCASPDSMSAGGWLPQVPKVSYASCSPFRPFRHAPDAELAAALDAFRPDVIFCPVERYITYKKLPLVVMVQNMAPLAGAKTGSGMTESLIALARKYETWVAVKKAGAVIVPTEYVKNFLTEQNIVPPGKATAIHYGYNAAPAATRAPESFPFSGSRFIFTAGSMEAYRGLEDLIRAFPVLREKHPGIKLAVAGGARHAAMRYLNGLEKLAAELKVQPDIAWLGDISGPELSWCYSNCSAFAVTSRMESFCFVALEALAHGCNMVSTDSACLPEVLGDAALYYAAGDENALSLALSTIISRAPVARAAAGSAAIARAAGFSWDKAAAATFAVLKKAGKAA